MCILRYYSILRTHDCITPKDNVICVRARLEDGGGVQGCCSLGPHKPVGKRQKNIIS